MLKKRKHEIHQQVDSPISEKDNVPKDFDFRFQIKQTLSFPFVG